MITSVPVFENLKNSSCESSTMIELLRFRSFHEPHRVAYTFLADEMPEEHSLTYGELDRRARAIGAYLQSQVSPGERAMLLYPSGLEFIAAFIGCLYAGIVAIPAYPPHPARLEKTLPKLQSIANDARPAVVLATSSVLAAAKRARGGPISLAEARWLETEDVPDEMADLWRDPVVGRESLAFLQYTSGSSAAPKGVMVSHGNLIYNSRMLQRGLEHTENSTIVIWLPLYHDMGLIGNILQSLFVGSRCVFMSPVSFLQRPFRWLEAVSQYRAETTGGPNFGYDLCVRKITPEQRSTLDLSNWKVAFNGAEPVRQKTLEDFTTMFAPCGFRRESFYPAYGLAEATVFVTGGRRSLPPTICQVDKREFEHGAVVPLNGENSSMNTRAIVGCGMPWLDEQVVIVDPVSLTRCRPDQVGEIWVSGPNVANGYWGLPEQTAATFRAYLADTGEGPFLRTGDLGFLRDGELFVTGRLKSLLIIDGTNHYPQDIELTVVGSHPSLRPEGCAAFSIDIDNAERLIVAVEVDRHYRPLVESPPDGSRYTADGATLVRTIKLAIAQEHDLPVYAVSLLKLGSIPKTTSGKIQRQRCREQYLSRTLEEWGASEN